MCLDKLWRIAAVLAVLLLIVLSRDASAGPTVSVTDRDSLQTDVNADGKVNRGDTVRHTITIRNTGDADASGAGFSETIDSNTTLEGSFKSTPVAVDDAYSVNQGGTLTTPAPGVLSNDIDPDGDTLTAIQVTGPAHGTLSLNSDGSFTYTPSSGYSGTDSFTYKANDGTSDSNEAATVTITVTVPPSITSGNATTFTAGSAGSFTVTTTGFPTGSSMVISEIGTLPTGVTFTDNHDGTATLAGTPTQSGTFPITITANNGATPDATQGFTLTVNCQTITVTNPTTNTGTVNAAFSQTFTQSGSIGSATFSTASTLPAGLSLSSSGLLSGTPLQPGTFPIVVTATDSNGCTGSGATYNLTINCQTITVTNPATNTGTAGVSFSQTFTQSGAVGGATFTTSSTLPAGVWLTTSGVLTGTPTQTGSFPIVVTVTDGNGCTGAGATYTLTIACQAMTLSPTAVPTATDNVVYDPVTFTETGGLGPVTISESGTLPVGMSFTVDTLSGTPTETGSFPITITATDSNGCQAQRDYLLVVECSSSTLDISPGTLSNVVVNSPFTQIFTASGGAGSYTFSEAGTLPAGMSFAVDTLSGTPTETGSFPITISVTDASGCAVSQDYLLVVTCSGTTITVTPGSVTSGTVDAAYGPVTCAASGGTGPYTLAEAGALPAGMSFEPSTGLLSGTPTQLGTYPFTVSATDANGCPGSIGYSLTINCQTITVINPATTQSTAGQAFSATFTVSGIIGTVTWSETGALPTGITLNPTTGVLSGTTTQTGSFPITVKATDSNGCFGTSSYTLTIVCQTITVTNPATTQGTAGVAFSQTFTNSGILGTATWSETGTLPTGLTLNTSTGVLSGTPTQTGSFPITVTATDTNGCSGTGATYNLNIICPTITVSRVGGGSFPQGTYNSAYTGQSVTASGSNGTPYTFTITSGALPTGLSMSSSGAISGTPSATGTFTFTVTVTDQYGCTGSQSFSIAVKPNLGNDSYSNVVNNTQEVITGGLTSSPSTPFTYHTTRITANDSPSVMLMTGTFATTAGGSITVASDGTFIYTPPTTNITTDSYTYTASSNTGGTGTPVSATATITLNFANRVWYVQPNAGVNGDGRSNTPFNNTSALGASGQGTTGDIIYVYNGNSAKLATKITLLENQQLIGQGVALSVNGYTLVAAGTAPTITNTSGTAPRNVIAVNNGNTITGVTLTSSDTNATAASLISGSPAGLTVSSSTLQTSGAGCTAHGINLSGGSGTITISNVTVNGSSSGDMIKSNTGTHSWSFTNSPITQTTGRALNVTGKTGGGMSFDSTSTITVSAGTTDGAITLSSNSGSETFSFSKIALTTSGARGLVASSSGTISNSDGTSTLSSTSATALDVQNTNIGTSGLTFRNISSSGGISNGITLVNTGSSGGLTVTGDGVNTSVGGNSSGGTISNKSGSDGSATGIGIFLNNTSNVVLRRMTITGINQNYGIRGYNLYNFTLQYSTVSGSNGTAASLPSPENYGEGGVFFGNSTTNGLTGTSSITNCNISGGRARNLSVVNGGAASTGTLTIKGNIFGAMQTNTDGNQSFAVEPRTSGSTFNVVFGGTGVGEGNTLNNSVSDLANFTGQTGTTMDVQFRNNTLSNNNPNNVIGGGSLVLATAGTMTFNVAGNSMRDANGSAVTFFKAGAGSGTPSMSGIFTNNTIGVSGVTDSGSKTGNGIFVSAGGTGTMSFTITNNQIHQIHGNSHIYADNTGGSYTANFTITGNTFDMPATPSAGWFAGIAMTNGAPHQDGITDDTVNVCADIRQNILNLDGNYGFYGYVAGAATGHAFNLPGYTGGANVTNVANFIQNNNSGTFIAYAEVQPDATAAQFTGNGTSCPTP